MRRITLAMALFAPLGCDGSKDGEDSVWSGDDSTGPITDDSAAGDDSTPTEDTHDTVDTGEPFTEDPPETLTCDEQPAPPFEWEAGVFVPPSEDFAFGPDGKVYNIDPFGNLIASDFFETREVVVPSAGYSAGIAFIDAEHLAYNDVSAGAVKQLGLDGSQVTLLGGLSYPNGLSVGLDGWVYVAENSGNRVQRVDPITLESEVISDLVQYPNGVSFSPDYETVYVGSFGGGFIYGISRDDDGVWQTRIHGHVPYADDHAPCDGLGEGEDCLMPWGGLGTCVTDDVGLLECNIAVRDTDACDGLADADPCTTDVLGVTVESLCVTASNGELFCPSHEDWRVTACDGKVVGMPCSAEDGERGTCYSSWEAVPICTLTSDTREAAQTCDGLAAGDDCVYDLPYSPMPGTCTARGDDLMCTSTATAGAGLDGINVDSCGNVYVTEYGPGIVWQIAPDGTTSEAATLPSSWIPNMHFGLGKGGFHRNVMYVMNYTSGGLFKIYTGVEGKPELVMPE